MNDSEVFDKANQYLDYFKDSNEKLRQSYAKCLELERIMETQLKDISNSVSVTRGSQRYLIDHIANAIALQGEIQSITKDFSDLRKTSLTYAIKDLSGEASTTENDDVLASITAFINKQKISDNDHDSTIRALTEKIKKEDPNAEAELDAAIAERLKSTEARNKTEEDEDAI